MTKIVLVQTKTDRISCMDNAELEFLLGLGGILNKWGNQMKIVKATNEMPGGYDELIDVLQSIRHANNTL